MSNASFTGIGIEEDFAARLAEFGIAAPTPIQEQAIPPLLEGRDVLAASQTGTGKTLAYLLPLLQRIDPSVKQAQKLILAPTQELAMQIVREADRYGAQRGIGTIALIGGAAVKRQVEKLREHPQLIVGTPGRIKELISMRKLKMHAVTTIVIDEADQMFQLGGAGDVEKIIQSTLRTRQLVMLSATIGPETRALAAKEMKDAVHVAVDEEVKTAAGLEHFYFVTEERDKMETLRRTIRHFNPARAIVFVNDTDNIAEVEAKLNYLGLTAGALYGDADKVTRSKVLSRFREGKFRVLVASDVAARGLDIEGLGLVVSYDPAFDSEHYVHRAGRTGRMGRKGLSVSLVTRQQEFIMRKFAQELGTKIEERVWSGGKALTPEEARAAGGVQRRPGKTAGPRPNAEASLPRRTASPQPGNGAGAAAKTAGATPLERRSSSPGGRTGTPGSAPAGGKGRSDRERDRKNKGAPKWLKDKKGGGGGR